MNYFDIHSSEILCYGVIHYIWLINNKIKTTKLWRYIYLSITLCTPCVDEKGTFRNIIQIEYIKIDSGQWYICYFNAWIWEDSFWMLVRFLLNLDSLIAYFFILVSTVDSLESVFSKFDSTRITLSVISLTRLSTWLFKLLMIESSSPLVSRPLAMYSSFWK